MEIPLLSIVIPTKDRVTYLISCLNSLTKINSTKIEIVVHDNSVEDIKSRLEEILNDSRIKYTHSDDRLSGVDNFDLAISKATGKYIMVIGDDDSCSKYIVNATEQLEQENIDALFSPKAIYYWPDITFKYYSDKFSGQLFIDSFSGKKKTLSAEHQRNLCLDSGACEIFDLPRVYHGIVKKEALDRVKLISKAYSPGPSPDIANAIALTYIIKSYKYVDIPFVITGNAAKSGAGMGTAKKHIGKIGAISFLPPDAEKHWSYLVPRFWSGQTVWAQSVIQSMLSCNDHASVKRINLPLLHAKAFIYNTGYRKEVLRSYLNLATILKKNKITWSVKYFFGYFQANMARVKPLLNKVPYLMGSNKSFFQHRYVDLKTVEEATKKLDDILDHFYQKK